MCILAAGDHFVLNSTIRDALREELGSHVPISELTLPWPDVPFGDVAEVHEASGSEEELIEALQGVAICVTQMAPLTRRVLENCPDLRLFAVGRGGPVNANLPAASEHGVAVTFAPGRNATATAEHTVALTLAAMRRVPQTHSELRSATWRGDYYRYDQVGLELRETTVGLVGFGAIGSRVARIMNGFGAHVLVHDPYTDKAAVEGVAEHVGLPELLSRSRVVSLHARVTPETTGMIGAAQIAAMPPDSVLVNCARGALLDYDAVCDALDRGHLFAAAFDVFPAEPVPPGSRLLRTPNIVMTPHLAGASRQTAHQAAFITAAEVGRFIRGEPLSHCANPEAIDNGGAFTTR
ncbi:2-hydroxyacid dehydrogenase [Wenjunlia tyrosinilytica]|uniref:Oxidoreductase n=1 Tax=Wenjunlia tyrosinilytica TaxID=1544741 RepID=A0A917ZTB9_9ACTN|nr:2-hydroxyacid dehydrogenase [Wenjunlia tyrosinilytica]GGO93991.1 oxidoreductase [Wenjunlia tyrosinilytica]